MVHSIYVLMRRVEFMITRMGTEEWAVVGMCLIILAFFSLRGFGNNARL